MYKAAIISTGQGRGTGAATILDHLLRGWEKHREPILVVAPRRSRTFETAVACGIDTIPLATVRDRWHMNLLSALRIGPRLTRCDVIHAWHSRGFEIAWILGRLLGRPATGTVHDHPQCSTHSSGRRHLIRLTTRRLSRVACVSHAVYAAWSEAIGDRNLEVITNGLIDESVAKTSSPKVRIGFLGMYSRTKGFDLVRDWIHSTAGGLASWRLYGVINEHSRNEARRLAEEYGEAVQFPGEVATRAILGEIDILVHASSEFDSFPTVLLEAAQAGVPAVASSMGGGVEIVESGTTGFLFDPAWPRDGLRALKSLISSIDLRRSLGAAARRRYEQRYQVSSMVSSYATFWRRTASETRHLLRPTKRILEPIDQGTHGAHREHRR